MLAPKRVKWRKPSKGRNRGQAQRVNRLSFGEFGLQSLEAGWVTARQLEASRVAIARSIKRGGKIWIRVFPQKSVTKKAAETRMGSGKGNPEFWVAVVKRERVMFELGDVDEATAKDIFKAAAYKLPIKTKIVRKEA